MRFALMLLSATLWQTGALHTASSARTDQIEAKQTHYERSLTLPAGSTGEACAVLDASVFAHASNESLSDLRVVRFADGSEQNIPFAVRVSEAAPTDAIAATAQNIAWNHGDLAFDLVMPKRPYTTVDLQLAANNFIADAQVWGMQQSSPERQPLGSFVIFDLTKDNLARSTSIALQESSFPRLHVILHMRGIHGVPLRNLPLNVVQGAVVPASREAQTLYTVVAATSNTAQQSGSSVTQIEAPAHIPVERIRFVLQPAYTVSFLRNISVSAEANRAERLEEIVHGTIWQIAQRPTSADTPAIHASKLTMDAVIASNMHQSALLKIIVDNGSLPAIPIQSIALEMRQRTVCFDAVAGARYALRYAGDNASTASVYDRGTLAKVQAVPFTAALGPELRSTDTNATGGNLVKHARNEKHSPQTPWILVLAAITLLGALAGRHTKRQGRQR